MAETGFPRSLVHGLITTGALLLAGLLVGVVAVSGGSPQNPQLRNQPGKPAKTIDSATQNTGPNASGILLGQNGVESKSLISENEQPGTTAWKIPATSSTNELNGFANLSYAHDGQVVTFYVNSFAPTYRVFAYRMGYYNGAGARQVWESKDLTGFVQPSCVVTHGINMVSCENWIPSFKVTLTSAFVQGDYLFKLVGSGNQQSYIPLTVWDPASRAAYLIKNDIFTWQAWNAYGGYDFYSGIGPCPANHYPLCSRARVVSFDRPYGYGNGSADFLANEYPLVYWAEKEGLDVSYVTDLTVVQHPGLLSNHTTLLSLGHDECWSYRERVAVQNATDQHGLNVVFFGASAMLRHVRLQDSRLGPGREEVDYRNSTADPLKNNPLRVTGNTWSSPPANWPEYPFVGENYAGYTLDSVPPQPLMVSDGSSWIFDGTGLHSGSVVRGVIQSDFDEFDPSLVHPANLEILAHSPLPIRLVQTNTRGSNTVYSDMTYYTNSASEGGIFDSGTNNWIHSLASCQPGKSDCPSTVIRQITGNLLRVFGLGPAGRLQPSVANWQFTYAQPAAFLRK